MLKYDFSVKTREGQKLDSIVIAGKDREDAERKLRQMYRHCDILRCDVKTNIQRPGRRVTMAALTANSRF
jgi:hypothetical protein